MSKFEKNIKFSLDFAVEASVEHIFGNPQA